MAEKSRGFTLLEISIVLAIVALVAGGILVSRDLIFSMQMRSQVGDIEKVRAAVLAFNLKYGCLPGDCRKASKYFSATSQPEQVRDGNGDREIDVVHFKLEAGDQNVGWGHGVNIYETPEWISVFDHLAAARMYDIPQYNEFNVPQGSVCNQIACPKLRFKSKGAASDVTQDGVMESGMQVGYVPGYLYLKSGNKIVLGAGSMWAGASAGINPWEAEAIDAKLDDGRPMSGRAVVGNKDYIYRLPPQGCSSIYSPDVYFSEKTLPLDSGGQVKRYRDCPLYINAEF